MSEVICDSCKKDYSSFKKEELNLCFSCAKELIRKKAKILT